MAPTAAGGGGAAADFFQLHRPTDPSDPGLPPHCCISKNIPSIRYIYSKYSCPIRAEHITRRSPSIRLLSLSKDLYRALLLRGSPTELSTSLARCGIPSSDKNIQLHPSGSCLNEGNECEREREKRKNATVVTAMLGFRTSGEKKSDFANLAEECRS